MLTETTVTKLQEMRLSVMAKAFKEQLTDPDAAGLSFEDRFGLMNIPRERYHRSTVGYHPSTDAYRGSAAGYR